MIHLIIKCTFIHILILFAVNNSNAIKISQLGCSFDEIYSYCNWSPGTGSNWKWGQMNFRSVNFTGPLNPVGHQGSYIESYDRSKGQSYSATATLQSQLIEPTTTPTCFQFYYFIYGVGADRLDLGLINALTSEESNLLWSRRYPFGDMWHFAQIHIPVQKAQFRLSFSAVAGGGAIALDQFTGIPAPCPTQGTCDFESGMCDWTVQSVNGSAYKFKIIRASDESDGEDMADHTTGTDFGHLLQASNGKRGDQALITKETPYVYWSQCLIFWYYREHSFKNKLDVLLFGLYNKNVSVWTSSLTFPLMTWHRAVVPINRTYGDYQKIGIAATYLENSGQGYSPINLDDIAFKIDSCPQPITCDFNVDMCGFTHNYISSGTSGVWTWDIGYGRVENEKSLLFTNQPTDQNAPVDGMFMYTDFTSLNTFYSYRTMRMDSEYVKATSASCLSFKYIVMNIDQTGTFTVSTIDNTGKKNTKIWSYDKSKDTNTISGRKNWVNQNIPITSTQEFKLSFQVSTNVPSTYIALDDVAYQTGLCSSSSRSTSSLPPPTTTQKPVPENQAVACNFDDGTFCGWKQVLGSPWQINAPANGDNYPMMPSTDHSMKNINGRYAYIRHSSDDYSPKPSITAVMTVNDSSVTHPITASCFSLWFYMRTDRTAVLTIKAYAITKTVEMDNEVVLRHNNWGEKWNYLRFETYEDQSYDLFSITANVAQGFIAIDDIKLSHQPCKEGTKDTFQCDFEDENSYSCGFAPLYSVTLPKWVLYQASTVRAVDHTLGTDSGHFMAIIDSYNETMASMMFGPTQGSCVSFAYRMTSLTDRHVLNFQIEKERSELNDGVLWSLRGDQGGYWYKHRLTVKSSLRWRMAFTAVGADTKSPNAGFFAIDDVMIDFDNACPPKGKCDFETGDTCMWENVNPSPAGPLSQREKTDWAKMQVNKDALSIIMKQSDFTWFVHSPMHGSVDIYPLKDHTTQQKTGYYLLMDVTRTRAVGDRSILVSDLYDINPTQPSLCLKFYYQFGSPNAQITLDVYQSERYTSVRKIAQLKTPTIRMSDWMPFNVTVGAEYKNSTDIRFYLVATIMSITASVSSSLAIDDISITPGKCVSSDTKFVCSATQSVSLDKVCNKVDDCANGHDEKVCGSCDFEKQFQCGYTNTSSNANPNDLNAFKWRFGDHTTGPRIGADGTQGFMFAGRLPSSKMNPFSTADLVTPVMHKASASCYVTFKYNIRRDKIYNWTKTTLKVLLSAQNSMEMTEIFNSDATDVYDNQWVTGVAYLKRMSYDFQLIFRASDSGTDSTTYVAVDSIRFYQCDLPQISTQPCTSNRYQCSNGVCISKYDVCDFADNCGDASDEKSCGDYAQRCNFEAGNCGWTGGNIAGAWRLAQGYPDLLSGETRDHTTGMKTGHFMYMSAAYNQVITDELRGPIITTGPGCGIQYWADIVGNASLSISVLNRRTGVKTKLYSEQRNTRSAKYERTGSYTGSMFNKIDPTTNYQIILKGEVSAQKMRNGKTLMSYIAVDDISITPQCKINGAVPTGTVPTIKPTKSPCPSNKPYRCADLPGTVSPCIEMSRVCDFSTDCPLNDDENNCGTCDFDRGNLCGWRNIRFDKQRWALHNASSAASNAYIPHTDSTGNKTGGYVIIDTSLGGVYDRDAIMATPVLGATGPNCKMTFWYQHAVPKPPELMHPKILTISLYFTQKNVQKKLMEVSAMAFAWSPVAVDINNMTAPFQVLIAAHGQVTDQTRPYADVAIDNITFTQCEPYATFETSLNCTFESDTCGWTDVDMRTNSKLDWIRTRSKSVNPGYDHTSLQRPTPFQSGYWLTTNRMPQMDGNNTATLMTVNPIQTTAINCLTFWYHMWGSDVTDFSLVLNQHKSEVGGTVLWIKRRPQSNNWVREMVTVQSSLAYYLMFRATLFGKRTFTSGSYDQSWVDTIGLDDITWARGQCPPHPLCDFETDMCSWVSADKAWARIVPDHVAKGTVIKPKVDHTLGIGSGGYMKIVGKANSAAVLSYTFQSTDTLSQYDQKNLCLKFWYFRAISSNTSPYDNPLSVELSTNHTTNPAVNKIWSINELANFGFFNDNWMNARVNISLFTGDVIRINGKISTSDVALAVDDLLLQSHPCEPLGWCDFESDFCGWSSPIDSFGWNGTKNAPVPKTRRVLWLRNSGATTTTYKGPESDHTTGTREGWYAFVPLDSQENGTAILESEPLSYPMLCIKFYYQITSDVNKIVTKLQLLYQTPDAATKGTAPVVIANISSHTNNEWQAFSQTYEIKNVSQFVYRLMFKTVEGMEARSDVAIDDIQVFGDSCAVVDSQRSTTQSPVSPKIPANEKAFDCDFESTGCKWNTDTAWKLAQWKQGNSQQLGPPVDHTTSTSAGHYLLLDATKLQSGSKIITYTEITSESISFTDSDHCLTFWYYSDSESYFNISIGYTKASTLPNKPLTQQNLLFMTPTMVSKTWKPIRVQLPLEPNIKIQIRILLNKIIVGALAIDDISVTAGKCPVRSGQVCDFSFDNCGFAVNRKLPVKGTRIGFRADEMMVQNFDLNGPKLDHTTKSNGSFFLFTNQANDPNVLYNTELIIPGLPSTGFGGSCLKFWYQINTKKTNSFQIYVSPVNQYTYRDPKWTVTYPNHTAWTMGQMSFHAYYPHKIVFSLWKSLDLTYIALDDISISNGVCEQPVSCSFDVDSCSWHDVDGLIDSNWNWGRFTGPPSDVNWPGPWLDHTLKKSGGTFLYITAYRDNPNDIRVRNAYIESMPVLANTSYCLSFWAHFVGDSSLQVIAVKYGKVDRKTQRQTLLTLKNTTTKWTQFSVNIDSNLMTNAVEIALRIKGSFTRPKSFLALDDIALSSSNINFCNKLQQKKFICSEGTEIDIKFVCNFKNDCPDGEDELNCGNCDFEQGTCGWTNTLIYNDMQWERVAANDRTKNYSIPVDGHNNRTGNYMKIEHVHNNYGSFYIGLQSNPIPISQLKGAYTTCRMYFDYYMNTEKTSLLYVVVREATSGTQNYVWRTTAQQNKQWKTSAVVDIGEHRSPFTVEVVGDARSPLTDIIAIDDIVFKNCGPVNSTTGACAAGMIKCPDARVCIDQFSLCDGIDDCGSLWDESPDQCSEKRLPKCSFESNNLCGFTLESDPGIGPNRWTIKKSEVGSYNRMTGPLNDHTYRIYGIGYYLALKGSIAYKQKTSRFVSKWMESRSGTKCAIRLFYYMFGNQTQMGSLRIYGRTQTQTLNNPNPFYKKGNLGQQWFRAIVPVDSQTPFQFVIEGQIGSGSESDIAIDDISFSTGCVLAQTIPTTRTPKPTLQTLGTSRGTVTTTKSSSKPVTQAHSTGSTKKVVTSQTQSTHSGGSTGSTVSSKTTASPSANTPSPTKNSKLTTTKSTGRGTSSANPVTATPGPGVVKGKSPGSKKPKFGTVEITATVLVPVLIIALIIGILLYRRKRRNSGEEDRFPLNASVIHLNERQRN